LGLAEGDVILSCGGSPTTCPMDLLRALLTRDPEADCTLAAARGETKEEFTFRTGTEQPRKER
jgi:S1-C subfamily serine protease